METCQSRMIYRPEVFWFLLGHPDVFQAEDELPHSCLEEDIWGSSGMRTMCGHTAAYI